LIEKNKENIPGNQPKYRTPENLKKAGNYLQKGGEAVKQKLIKAAYFFGKSINKPTTENVMIPKTIQELKNLQPRAQFIDFQAPLIAKLIATSDEIQKIHENRNIYYAPGLEPQSHMESQKKGWETFKQGTTSGAKSFWGGFHEAAAIICKPI